FLDGKILHARFFAENILPHAKAHSETVLSAARTVVAAEF
ncbi:MAG: hypothetical protein DI626_10745, partial [Micavibrio aeruginosavorus]